MRYRDIVVLTGAGVSAESGLSTFRDKEGVWRKYDLTQVATPEAFRRDPAFVNAFYNMRRQGVLSAEPNEAHRALARLESGFGGRLLVVTQNVDDLHERAGSRNLIHMHGELLKARCASCGDVRDCRNDLSAETLCRRCSMAGGMRPHVVWFGEIPLHLEAIGTALRCCDLFVSIGTSGSVYPAAGFVSQVRAIGRAHTLEINLEPSESASLFAERRRGPAGVLAPAFVEEILGSD